LVKQSQIAVSAPDDDVLQNSAMGFMQGLYPPVGAPLDTETLRNGTTVTSPLQGYQLIPIEDTTSGSGSEDNGWLQSSSGCASAVASSNEYFLSKEYQDLLVSTQELYNSIAPAIDGVFSGSQVSFKNAYTSISASIPSLTRIFADAITVYDYVHVAEIHNATIPSANLLTNDTLFQLQTLADAHEWGLAYNSSNDARAIAGKTLAGEVLEFLNGTITGHGKQKMGIQFGAYGTFASFFGLADLESVNPDFFGIVDYASSMAFELFTNDSTTVSSTDYPAADDLYVRFLFKNGTASDGAQPVAYPLFGSGQEILPWKDFTAGMNKFAVSSTEQWCTACGNTTGSCAVYAPKSSDGSSSGSSSESATGSGLSPAVYGIIGAMVTLAIVLGLETLVLLAGGFRVVSKKVLAGRGGISSMSVEPKSA
jgi:hypothetical protein